MNNGKAVGATKYLCRRIPRDWASRWPGLVAEYDVSPTRRGRLAAKVLVFRNPRALRSFWKIGLKQGELGRWTTGAVNGLISWKERLSRNNIWTRRITRADPRYFCVIGLACGFLTMEHIAHEAVHAGFCYAKRVNRTPWAEGRDFDEEEIAYPAGAIAAGINRFLFKKGLYPK